MATQTRSKKNKKKINPNGIVHIKATFNNTNITVTDENGNVIAWATAGKAGFKGSRKNTAYAATIASEKVASEVVSMGLASVAVRVKGPGAGRESAIRALSGAGLQVTSISDVTPLPHNGCRPKKQRRV
ncbi:30S ribosomal protein S11 [Candidatus Marinimicrobia bacterium]|jgi:small subunit ribosomal protein S11|nr:30S ribosomal protein S11 [Candidatus Neomarinimicrobiota bacterium]MDA9841690.1 30S ribosomal protein S11 [Candidatus Neomarinimicrobiota bacterium]MDB3887868.1 30S ribosomal protein S11 [Candidatus Neomarinimicrobiota bacterium]MDB3980440.1 30S ribosomal protein S11 [Candidatus Neomarinimicrobiota bacterium]MDC0521538.1 30S ribosomal protein S11 [Candidatus Neomarinimicrobiota bacterium]|tara:strand:+ start:166 stop:552 length:387 start_codon:yes stop_codon:yes gene_type:complete